MTVDPEMVRPVGGDMLAGSGETRRPGMRSVRCPLDIRCKGECTIGRASLGFREVCAGDVRLGVIDL